MLLHESMLGRKKTKALSPSFYYHESKDCFKILRAEQEKSDGNREEFSVSFD
jgi:hypothetical protein